MKTRLLFCFFVALAFNISSAFATTYQWYGNTGNWNVSGNWLNTTTSTYTGYPGLLPGDIAVFRSYATNNVTLTGTLPNSLNQIQTQVYSGCNITINSGATLTATSGVSIAGTYGGSYDGITFAGSGSAVLGGASTFSYYSTLTIGSSNTVTFSAGSTITMSNNYCGITNNGTLNFSGTSGSGITLSLAYYCSLANAGTLAGTYTTFTCTNNNVTFSNTNNYTLTSCTVNLGYQSTFTNAGTMSATSTTFALSANNTAVTNSNSFTANACTFTLTGQSASIANSGSTAVFNAVGCAMNLTNSNNYCNITNPSGSVFKVNGGSVISIPSYQGYISNAGTFYAGTSNSPCYVTLSAQGSYITNTGNFYVGSTSGVTLTGYTSTVNNSGTFTFQSDANGCGYAGAITTQSPTSANGKFNGTYNVERYITGGSATYRGYRLFSSPVYAATVSSNNVYSINYVQAKALVTGNAGGGFDKTGNPSLYLNREDKAVSNATFISGNFWGISAINNSPAYNYYLNGIATNYNIPVGNGFLFWFRGDRTTNLANKYTPGTSAESVTMTATGSLTQGPVTVHNWYTPSSANLGYTVTAGNTAIRGYNMVGNPYASPIDWETFQTSSTTTGIYGSNVGTAIYQLNPANQNYGVYIKGGGGVGTNNATNVIESGQGFFVAVANASAQLIFNESAKTTAQAVGGNLFMGKPVDNAIVQYLRLQLAKDTINTDDLLIRFDKSVSTAYSPLVDAVYKQGFGQVSVCSLSSDDVPLAINVRPLPTTSSSISLSVNTITDGTYQLNMKQIVGVPQLFDIWLMDNYKKDSLNMRDNASYTFDVLKSDTNSFGTSRFSLTIRQNPAYAYRLLNFTASKIVIPGNPTAKATNLVTTSATNTSSSTSLRQVQLVWTTENEQNYTNFTVERSTDNGKTYDVTGSVIGSAQGTYSVIDNNPADQNLYRLKQEDINNNITYSKIVPIAFAPLSNNLVNNNINVYPNPASSNINLTITNNITAASYHITVTTSTGLVVKQATSPQPNWQTNVSDLQPGTYLVKVFNSKTEAFIGNTKFVKL